MIGDAALCCNIFAYAKDMLRISFKISKEKYFKNKPRRDGSRKHKA